MTEYNRAYRRTVRAHRGQTLIIALAVLFILLFLGGFLITRIARNLVTAGRSRDTQDAQALAMAALDYCNTQLNTSPEGADWRPVPTTPTNNADPDYFWLERGFSRLPLNGGRALVRVAYDPNPFNPLGQALRIEAVGRTGELPPGGSDPTVFVPNFTAPRLRRELIGLKRIALTDYGMYNTGKDRRTEPNYIGTPGIGHYVATVLGSPMLGYSQYQNGITPPDSNGVQRLLFGFPIYSAGDLVLGGDTYLYESPRGTSVPSDPRSVPNDPLGLQQEGVQVEGQISLDPTHPVQAYANVDDTKFPAYLNTEIDNMNNVQKIFNSTDPNFSSYSGQVRDGNGQGTPQSDVNGYTRAVPRFDPPLIDSDTNGSAFSRYLALTRDSGYWYSEPKTNKKVNTGEFGYGNTGIYVDDTTDIQQETSVPGVNGAYSLRGDWLNPGAFYSLGNWQGPFYNPPRLEVQLLGNVIRLTRNDGKSFYNPDLTPNPENGGKSMDISLSDFTRKNTQLLGLNGPTLQAFPHDGDDPSNPLYTNPTTHQPASPHGDPNSYGVNVVLYADCNIGIRGVYGAITNPTQQGESVSVSKLGRVHLTVVSGGTIYIEGNLVRGDGYLSSAAPGGEVLERDSTCALLAKDYVCVNTTQFMQPQNATNVWSRITPDLDVFADELGMTRSSQDFSFSWGVNPGTYQSNGEPSPLFLMVHHGTLGATNSASLINILVNPALINPNPPNLPPPFPPANDFRDALYQFPFGNEPNSTNYLTTYAVAQPNSIVNFESVGFPLTNLYGTAQSYMAIDTPGYDNTIRFQLDQTLQGLTGITEANDDYLIGAAQVMPLDIRIEACIYAQNRSFFVIPGYSFNPDATDTRESYQVKGNVRVSYSTTDNSNPLARTAKDVFPFYNEPGDVRITIFGSIAQNYTASVGDQKAWMERWGFIPALYGSTYTYQTPIAVPDDHLLGLDSDNLVPGQDRTLIYRTPLETQQGTLPATLHDFAITNGLRYLYNPAFAMPYTDPTNANLSGTDMKTALQRKTRALRSIVTTITPLGSTSPYNIVQVLPSIPRLPVCPNYLYAGDSDRLIGTDITDTDNANDLN